MPEVPDHEDPLVGMTRPAPDRIAPGTIVEPPCDIVQAAVVLVVGEQSVVEMKGVDVELLDLVAVLRHEGHEVRGSFVAQPLDQLLRLIVDVDATPFADDHATREANARLQFLAGERKYMTLDSAIVTSQSQGR